MPDVNVPRRPAIHSHATATLGARLNLSRAEGIEHAKLLWLVILSHTPWDSLTRPTWASNVTLAREAGLDVKRAKLALQRLREAGLIATPQGHRPGARRPHGRLLILRLGAPVKVLVPDRHDMANLWGLCRERRTRPAPMVTMAVGAYALASDQAGHRPRDWTPLGCSQADWRRFVGARKNASWIARVRELESLDLIRRSGRAVEVAPARSWLRAARAIESSVDPPPNTKRARPSLTMGGRLLSVGATPGLTGVVTRDLVVDIAHLCR